MSINFEISEDSKLKMTVFYQIYSLDPKDNNTPLFVQKSYRKNKYNVYVFSEYMHVGLLKRVSIDGDVTIEQKVMGIDKNDSLSEYFKKLQKEKIEEMIEKEYRGENSNYSEFKLIQTKINKAIEEYITRKKVYGNYIETKKLISSSVINDQVRKITEKEKQLKKHNEKKIKINHNIQHIVPNGSNFGFRDEPEHIYLKINAYLENSDDMPMFCYTIEKNIDNLNELLKISKKMVVYHAYPTQVLSNEKIQLLNAIYRYVLIWAYYSSDWLFEYLFCVKQYIRTRSNSPVKTEDGEPGLIESYDILKKLLNRGNDLNSITWLFNHVCLFNIKKIFYEGLIERNIDYSIINDEYHLKVIKESHDIIVSSHKKKYIPTWIKDIEKSYFNLSHHLGGVKDTRDDLSSIFRIYLLKTNIDILRMSIETDSELGGVPLN